MQNVLDWLFRFGLYWGVRVKVPAGLIEFYPIQDGQFIFQQELSINRDHAMTDWLDECDGPWRIKAVRDHRTITPYPAFSRIDDAVMFRLIVN
jgi:hypothetical protein